MGAVFALDATGNIIAQLAGFKEEVQVIDLATTDDHGG